jgi:threonine dehydrogenase-like Zn-dependent dehydrogenase
MLRVKIQEPRKIFYENIDPPVAGKDQALINISAAGICGSDMHIYLGKNPGIKPPHVSGHEFGGIIKAMNGSRSGFSVGDKVMINPCINCGTCYYCSNGMEHLCDNQSVIGGHIPGGMTEEIVVPLYNLIKLPADFDMTYSPMIEPVGIVVHCLKNIVNLNVLVIGLGTIGLCAQQVLKMNGCTVLGTDIDGLPLKVSKQLGADFVFNYNDPGKEQLIEDFLKGEKIDLVFETVCSPATLAFSSDVVRKKGKIIIVGIPEKNFTAPILNILFKEIEVEGTSLYRDENFKLAVEYVVEGAVDVKSIVSKIFPLAQAAEAFEYKLTQPSIKILLSNED